MPTGVEAFGVAVALLSMWLISCKGTEWRRWGFTLSVWTSIYWAFVFGMGGMEFLAGYSVFRAFIGLRGAKNNASR